MGMLLELKSHWIMLPWLQMTMGQCFLRKLILLWVAVRLNYSVLVKGGSVSLEQLDQLIKKL